MKKKINLRPTWKQLCLYSISAVVLLLFMANFSVYYKSKDFLKNDVNKLSSKKVAVVLGTSRYLGNGVKNEFFYNRIDAVLALYKAGKVKYILVSGDNGRADYNEPEDMKQELIAGGIPGEKIYLDFAGFDTYDSMIRANKVFGLKAFIVVSQEFHNQRAVYIARSCGMDVVGFNAKKVERYFGMKTIFREYFACVKAFLDVNWGVSPRFLGEKIHIEKKT